MKCTSSTALLFCIAVLAKAVAAADDSEKVFGSVSGREMNLMDKITQINVNIGKSIPVNTIPDELRSGNGSYPISSASQDEEPVAAAVPEQPSDGTMVEEAPENNSKRRRHNDKSSHHRRLDRSLDEHRQHGSGSHVKLSHALAHNSTILASAVLHANGTAAINTHDKPQSTIVDNASKGSEGRRAQKLALRAATDKHAGITRKYGAGGK